MRRVIPAPITNSVIALLLGLLILLISGCEDKSVEPEEKKFKGIQIMFEDGRTGGTIGDASDDWLPLTQVGARLNAAMPNPVEVGSFTNISFSLSQQDSVRLWMESSPGKLDRVISQQRLPAGNYTVRLDLQGRPEGIYRIYMTLYRNDTSYTTYGDVMIAVNRN